MREVVEAHVEKQTFTETSVVPDHIERRVSSEFKKSVRTLKKDGHYSCWICGSTVDVEVHHFGCEWSMENLCDFDKLKKLLMIFDVYGYSFRMRDVPITTADDVRNMMCLCKEHHTGAATDGVANGIHRVTFPTWIIQKVCRDYANPVPTADGVDMVEYANHLDEVLESKK